MRIGNSLAPPEPNRGATQAGLFQSACTDPAERLSRLPRHDLARRECWTEASAGFVLAAFPAGRRAPAGSHSLVHTARRRRQYGTGEKVLRDRFAYFGGVT